MVRSIFPVNKHKSSTFCLLVISILLILYSNNETSGQTIDKITPESYTVKNSSMVVSPDFNFKITKTFQTESDSHFTQPISYNQSEGSSNLVPFAISNRYYNHYFGYIRRRRRYD